jgi:MoaA/NifB/PqqE/SkfB family radical SAM enzyme
MFKFNELKHLHLEISSNCQASCPMCSRNIHGGVENPLVNARTWTLEDFKTIVTTSVLQQISSISMCGGLGDPLMANDLIEMLSYVKEHKPNLHIHIHTNGSLRSKSWWTELANLRLEHLIVVFAIDGLSDTHSLYRIGTSYEKIIENADAFIKAGGNAEWVFIRFKHNEHQVDEAKRIAQEMGFKNFTMKDSSRFFFDGKFPVYNKDRETIYNLESSQYSEMKFIDRKIVDNYKQVVANADIKCFVKERKEVFIDAQGHLYGCCWIGTVPYQAQDEWASLLPIRKEIIDQHNEMIGRFGGYDGISTFIHSVESIIDSETYQTMWNELWGEKKMIMCARICGTNTNLSKPTDQAKTKEKLYE